MAKKKNLLFKSKERRTLGDVAAFLRQLADRLEQGEITLRRGADEVTLPIANATILKLKAKEKVKKRKTRRRLGIGIKWTEGDDSGDVVTLG